MDKNIYELLNDAKINTKDLICSVLESEEQNDIFNKIIKNSGEKKAMKKRKTIKKSIIAFAAVFAAASVSVVGATIYQKAPVYKNSDGSTEKSTVSSKNHFALSAGAYDDEENSNSSNANSLALKDNGTGTNNFTSMEFQIEGENISDVALSIDKGQLCKITKTPYDSDVYTVETEVTPDHTVDILGTDDGVFLYDYTNLGKNATEKFDPNVYYGFCISDDDFKKIEDENGEDLQKMFHTVVDEFDGAKLTVEVTYTDGEKESATYSLSSGKLKIDDNNNAIAEFAEDGAAYIYGLIANKE